MKPSKSFLLLSLGLFMFGQVMAQTTDKATSSQETTITTDSKKTAPAADKKINKQDQQQTQNDTFTLDEQADTYFGQPVTEKPATEKHK